ncbi:MAG: hypothetical protein AB7V43_02770 [Acidimicrobiia bacterium]
MSDVGASEQSLVTLRASASSGQWSASTTLERLRLLIVAGVPSGVIVIGLGSRVAMGVLRVTSPGTVRGTVSDDGFIIGRVTLAGTYNLLMLGAAVGIIGAGVYVLVEPWLLGPGWFRRLVVAGAAGSVGGSMLVHADGVDFTILEPLWLAIALFVALPAAFAVVVAMNVDALRRRGAGASFGARRWVLPTVLVACFPPVLLVVLFAVIVLMVATVLESLGPIARLRASLPYGLAMRTAWAAAALAGLVALVRDIDALV